MTDRPVPVLLADLRTVVVGSTNPVKRAAVVAVLARVAPQAEVIAVPAASGVPDQPWGDEETIAGARARARAALAAHDADLAIGLEGGVVAEAGGHVRTCAWAVALTRDGREGVGGSLAMPLPDRVAARLRAGEELGLAMDAEAQVTGTKTGRGAVGILTAGHIDRQAAYEPLVTYALAPLLAPAFYAEP
jgi:inosine/xanthosine triphosphatase